jgi:hypothetical protein
MKSVTLQLAESISTAFEVERALTESEEIQVPLLPLTGIYDSDPSPLTPPSPPNTLALIDSLTTTLARAVAVAPLGELNPGHCICQFKPVGLSLFDLILLARVVHEHAPIYGLFDNQCYMFSSVIFDAGYGYFDLGDTYACKVG